MKKLLILLTVLVAPSVVRADWVECLTSVIGCVSELQYRAAYAQAGDLQNQLTEERRRQGFPGKWQSYSPDQPPPRPTFDQLPVDIRQYQAELDALKKPASGKEP